ncbi:DUF3572 family protein [Novosphingobium sp. 17-62-19]|nr:DUF3572 family protein [Novosphingobium sp. 17-62-19]
MLSDAPRAERFLDLTGLTPEELRTGLSDPAISRSTSRPRRSSPRERI